MQLTENEAAEVKKWVVRKLEDISDADSDVLADYVLALIRTDAPDEDIRKASVDNLEDFLREHTVSFVDELFATFASKPQPAAGAQQPSDAQNQSQDPQAAAATGAGPQNPPQQNAFNPPIGPSKGPYGAPQMGNAFPQQAQGDNQHNFNRKRTFQEGFQMDVDREDVPQNRNYKTPRRGRGGGRGDWMGGRDGRAGPGQQQQSSFNPQAASFVMPPTFPPFDQNDPMATMMALQSMGFPQMPGMPPMPMPPVGAGQQPGEMVPKSSERCPFYETQGICYLGTTCPYQHDTNGGASKTDEYDPKSSSIVTDYQRRSDGPPMRGGDRGRGRGRGGDRGGFGGRGRRSEFSSAGPNEDTSITTIVVEQIPDDKLEEATVREFFAQYGEIVDISLQPHRRLALITYENHAGAKSAWSSPKVIFDNRFVKVYWHKPKGDRNGDSRPHHGDSEGPAFNREEFEKQQEEAQRTYEEKLKKRKETEEAKQALERQRDELLKKQQEERQRLMQKLGGTVSGNGDGPVGSGEASPDGRSPSTQPEHVSEQTKQLRAQLAALEAEAKSLGLDPNAAPGSGYRGRGRGGYGRGGYAPRGRGGYDSHYRGGGGYRGRGGLAGRGGVLRLDNRPKRVAVSGVEFDSEKDEALRQFLIGVGEYSSIEPNPDQPDSLIVAFKERYQAEKFMFGPRDIPSVGQVELAWVPNPPIYVAQPAATGPGSDTNRTGSDEDTLMDTTPLPPAPSDLGSGRKDGGQHDVDYDVAEMDDSWGAE
ncbi:CCCH zinc finger and RRM domain protein [Aspergillus saccharolyticus JOP 1030-1]|uniref:CCCH zinc finger and RRM domain protein n=1 Tax=Aspergillus saccharolyticus JOP 1030-1 TaxID=1450539 RepID=A0A318ZYE5_9EURO|nr:hypothetical protein BP01DRAFT_310654 [Aspergillus saccharolyticus JOP 1030-1]PYH49220.1 hypothetical protein BP01DRAFT_310654 [Aspergillus saccharolyticus JOP 1030-1]